MLGGSDSFIRCNIMENSGFKIKFDKNWNESLSEVESEKEINMFKEVSSLKF